MEHTKKAINVKEKSYFFNQPSSLCPKEDIWILQFFFLFAIFHSVSVLNGKVEIVRDVFFFYENKKKIANCANFIRNELLRPKCNNIYDSYYSIYLKKSRNKAKTVVLIYCISYLVGFWSFLNKTLINKAKWNAYKLDEKEI